MQSLEKMCYLVIEIRVCGDQQIAIMIYFSFGFIYISGNEMLGKVAEFHSRKIMNSL